MLTINGMKPYHDNRCYTGGREKGKPLSNLIKIRGIVIPTDWDGRGNVVAVALSAYNEHEYLIDTDEKGSELRAFMRKEVEVSGSLRKEKNRQIITVKEIEPCAKVRSDKKIK